MISNLNQSSEAFLANVERVQRTVDDASRQVSSGKRVNVASDAPDEIDTIMQLQTGAGPQSADSGQSRRGHDRCRCRR